MRKLKAILLAVACIAALSMSSGNVAAQGGGGGGGRGNFDPAQFRQRRLDRYKEQFEVTDDAEWNVLSAAIGKVMDAEQAVQAGAIRGGGGRNRQGGGQGGQGGGGQGGDNNNGSGQGGGRQRGGGGFGGFGGTPSQEATDLQTAIDNKAPADEIKTKLAALRAANAGNVAKLTAAQDDLKKLLTSRQEAIAVINGLLK
jgi:hypothetical protein